MIKKKNGHSALLKVSIAVLTLLSIACSNNNKHTDFKDKTGSSSYTLFEEKKNEKDVQFLLKAAEFSKEEICMAQQAQRVGSANHIKDLGKLVETQHALLMTSLNSLNKEKNMPISSAQTISCSKINKKLNNKSAKDFDKNYTDMMVSGHLEAIEIFEDASIESVDLDIRAWATDALFIIRSHLNNALVSQKRATIR